MYRAKYYKYKAKYYKFLSGGKNYDITNEKKYNPNNKTNIEDLLSVEYITGLASMFIMESQLLKTNIIMIGDLHECVKNGFDTDNKNTGKEMYIVDYLALLFKKYSNKNFDFLLEQEYNVNKQIDMDYSASNSCVIDNSTYKFKCFQNLSDKTKCNSKYPNVRFHNVDIRHWYDESKLNSNDDLQNFLLEENTVECDINKNDLIPKMKTSKLSWFYFHQFMRTHYPITTQIINIGLENKNYQEMTDYLFSIITSNYKFKRYQNLPFIDKINDYLKNNINWIFYDFDFFSVIEKNTKKISRIIDNPSTNSEQIYYNISKYIDYLIKYCIFIKKVIISISIAIFDYYTLIRIFKIIYQYPDNSEGKNIILIAGSNHINNLVIFLLMNKEFDFHKIYNNNVCEIENLKLDNQSINSIYSDKTTHITDLPNRVIDFINTINANDINIFKNLAYGKELFYDCTKIFNLIQNIRILYNNGDNQYPENIQKIFSDFLDYVEHDADNLDELIDSTYELGSGPNKFINIKSSIIEDHLF